MTFSPRRQLALVLLLAFGLRLAAGWAWEARLQQRFGMGDSETYWSLARTIAEGQPYAYGEDRLQVFRTPGYPILLAPVLWLFGDGPLAVAVARAEAALLGTLAVLAVWWLTRLLFQEQAARLAALLAAIYPGAVAMGAMILSEAPFTPWMLLQLALWGLAWRSSSPTKRVILSLVMGAAAGVATLMRPSWLLFTPFALAIGMLLAALSNLFDRRQRNRQVLCHLVIGGCGLLGLSLTMSPWWIRNYLATGHFVPTTLQVGASLYDGLSPIADGSSNMDFVPRFVAEEKEWAAAQGDQPQESLELRLDRRMRVESLAWATTHPGAALRLAGVKFLRMWNIWPNEPSLSRWPLALAVLFTYTPLLIFAIMGAWRTFSLGWPYILCWLPAVYLTMLHVVFVSSIRYREPAMLALLALAAAEIQGRWNRRFARSCAADNPRTDALA